MTIAIDPGKSGGFAFVDRYSDVAAEAMPDTEGDIITELADMTYSSESEKVCIMEVVSGYIGAPQPGSAMFKFGENYGFLKGVIMSNGFKLHLVRPQEWQKGLGLGNSRGMKKTAWKNKLKAEAQRLYPHLKVTMKTADALLILEYYQRIFKPLEHEQSK